MLGLYIHIPFCKRKCPYCDFVSYDNFDYLIDDYINTLFNELQIYKKKFNPFFETVYIGGGTPSILSNKQLKKFFSKLFSIVERAKIKEITFEVNPGTLDDDKIKIISENINRVSVGVQSFNDDILKFIGRIHNSKEIFLTFDKLKKSGIKNINMNKFNSIYLTPGTETMKKIHEFLTTYIENFKRNFKFHKKEFSDQTLDRQPNLDLAI